MKLVCYCCGQEVGKEFCLVTMAEVQADRAFIMLPDHAKRADYATIINVVRK